MKKTVTLSDGEECEVAVLPIFGLDEVAPDKEIGPFYYDFKIGDQVVQDVYDPFRAEVPPQPPAVPRHECLPGSVGALQWEEYDTYRAAVVHWERNYTLLDKYYAETKRYILKNCLSPEDRKRVVTPEDMDAVYHAALVPQVEEGIIADVLRKSFQGAV